MGYWTGLHVGFGDAFCGAFYRVHDRKGMRERAHMHMRKHIREHMSETETETDRERAHVCVCVCVREREHMREKCCFRQTMNLTRDLRAATNNCFLNSWSKAVKLLGLGGAHGHARTV